MKNQYTHHKYDRNSSKLIPLTEKQYFNDGSRSHPNRPPKDRGLMTPAVLRLIRFSDSSLREDDLNEHFDTLGSGSPPERDAPPGTADFEDLSRHPNPYTYLLSNDEIVKVTGYNAWEDDVNFASLPVASTGTSQTNRLCVTDNMGPCIAVAIGGEGPSPNVRVFHVFDNNTFEEEITSYVEKIKNKGLSVKAAMHGGDHPDDISQKTANDLRALFRSFKIELEFDETCEKKQGSTPLGAVILPDRSILFVKEVVTPDPQRKTHEKYHDAQERGGENFMDDDRQDIHSTDHRVFSRHRTPFRC
jgi:hypothetical protein